MNEQQWPMGQWPGRAIVPKSQRRDTHAVLRLTWDIDQKLFVAQTPVPWVLLDDPDALSHTVRSIREGAARNASLETEPLVQIVEPGPPDHITDLIPGKDYTL